MSNDKKLGLKVVSNKYQLTLLVDLLCRNPNIAKGICSKPEAQMKFEEFAIQLNEIGPPEREWHKWMRVWTDLKCKVKKKKIEKQAVSCPPGAVRNPRIHLSELEERVIKLLDLDSLPVPASSEAESELDESRASGISSDETKFTPMDFEQEMLKYVSDSIKNPDEDDELTAIKSEPASPVSIDSFEEVGEVTKKQPIAASSNESDDYQKLLEKQTSAQKEFYERMTELMGDVRRSMNNIEDYIKTSVKQKNELLELKKQKLKAFNTAKIQQKIDARMKLKLQSELLEIKKKKQQLKMDKH